jgi:hypothetical protein
MGRAEARSGLAQRGGKKDACGLRDQRGVDETITPLTHLALLTSEEAQKVELWDFFQGGRGHPAPL